MVMSTAKTSPVVASPSSRSTTLICPRVTQNCDLPDLAGRHRQELDAFGGDTPAQFSRLSERDRHYQIALHWAEDGRRVSYGR